MSDNGDFESRKELGEKGEKAAAAFLENRGLEILDKNWKCSYGEADIIALDGTTLVFCEVKTRRSTAAGIPEEAVTAAKQKRYTKIARVYSSRTRHRFESIRFDVIAIYAFSRSQALLRYIRNAFDAIEV
ncbi:MAG: YraN family protein [Coriobacteriia bacterium]|nr:YraN family protein [Coriobacteriia bacterium]